MASAAIPLSAAGLSAGMACGFHCVIGTYAGLLVAAVALGAFTHPVFLVLLVIALQFPTELYIMRHYGLSVWRSSRRSSWRCPIWPTRGRSGRWCWTVPPRRPSGPPSACWCSSRSCTALPLGSVDVLPTRIEVLGNPRSPVAHLSHWSAALIAWVSNDLHLIMNRVRPHGADATLGRGRPLSWLQRCARLRELPTIATLMMAILAAASTSPRDPQSGAMHCRCWFSPSFMPQCW